MHSKANKKMFSHKKSKYDAITFGIGLIQLSKEWNDLLRLHQYSFFTVVRNRGRGTNHPHFSTKIPTSLAKYATVDEFGDNSPRGFEAFVSFLDHDSLRKIIIGDHKRRFSCSHPHDLATFADLRIWLNTFRLN